LWQAKTGRMQRVHVDVDAAAIGMRSSRYIRIDDPENRAAPRRAAGGGLGIYRTKDDRWFYFQRLFEHHRRAQLSVLQCEDTEEGITAAVAGWNGLELEEAVIAAGASAGMIRTPEEWRAHEQAQ